MVSSGKIKFNISVMFLAIAMVFGGSKVLAATQLPEMIVGQTTLTTQGSTYYGGMTGNYAVLNYDDSYAVGFDGTSTSGLTRSDCQMGNLLDTLCFNLGTGVYGKDPAIASNFGHLMRSNTTVSVLGGKDTLVYEMPALFFSNTVIGDTFGLNSGLPGFDYWNKSLALNGTDTNAGAAWQAKGYTLNPDAQMTWDGSDTTNPTFSAFNDKLQLLTGSGVPIDPGILDSTTTQWYLSGANSIADPTKDLNYPEGKVWMINGDLHLTLQGQTTRMIQYQGVGTIIVKGSIIIDKGVSIEPLNAQTDRIGFVAE